MRQISYNRDNDNGIELHVLQILRGSVRQTVMVQVRAGITSALLYVKFSDFGRFTSRKKILIFADFWFLGFCTVCKVSFLTTFGDPLWVSPSMVISWKCKIPKTKNQYSFHGESLKSSFIIAHWSGNCAGPSFGKGLHQFPRCSSTCSSCYTEWQTPRLLWP
jgi:hypothetical protein